MFFINSILLGVALAMDAFSVSVANSIVEVNMKKQKMFLIAFMFGLFQFAMPLIGYISVNVFVNYFNKVKTFIPFISLILLSYIGVKMIYESCVENKSENNNVKNGKSDVCENSINKNNFQKLTTKITISLLLLQAIATSIDALSVGFTLQEYNYFLAILASIIIGIITFFICFIGLILGKKIGQKFEKKAEIIGGVILILIGLEIFIKSFIR